MGGIHTTCILASVDKVLMFPWETVMGDKPSDPCHREGDFNLGVEREESEFPMHRFLSAGGIFPD